jgi:hypothetical protein
MKKIIFSLYFKYYDILKFLAVIRIKIYNILKGVILWQMYFHLEAIDITKKK